MSVLEDKDAIREIMAAYCRALDSCRFADVASLFADDAVWTTDYGNATGRKAIEEMLQNVVPAKGEGPQRKHYTTNIIIKVDGDRRAQFRTIWSCAKEGRTSFPLWAAPTRTSGCVRTEHGGSSAKRLCTTSAATWR
jgi:uncharacterized protein (TIGR02246 family)